MARQWSNSGNGNLRYSVNRQNQSGIFIGPTRGLSSPKNSRRACLCIDKDTYSVNCCKGALIQQGIGQIQSTRPTGGGFDLGYSDGFDTIDKQ
jgi:hypothetical protein